MKYDNVSVCISSLFASVSLVDIENMLNITILILSIINILLVLILKIYNKIKDKHITINDLQEVKNDVDSAIDDLNKLKGGE